MTMPYLQENEFKDPIIFQKRESAISKTDTNKKILNNIIVLDEIPEFINHIQIENYYEVFDKKATLASNQFRCIYTLGILIFNPSEENKTIPIIDYYSRGVILTPASRIYLHNENPDVIQNLQELVDSGEIAIRALNDLPIAISSVEIVTHNAQNAINEVNSLNSRIEEAEDLRNEAEIDRLDNENIRQQNEIKRIDNETDRRSKELIRESSESTRAREEATRIENENLRKSAETARLSDETTRQNNESIRQSQETVRQNNNNIMMQNSYCAFKQPVTNFAAIATTYKTPENGWTTQTEDNGKIYRYNISNLTWEWIGTITPSVYTALLNSHKYFWKEEKTVLKDANTIVLTNTVSSNMDLRIIDLTYGVEWLEGSDKQWTRVGQTITFTSSMPDNLTFRIWAI